MNWDHAIKKIRHITFKVRVGEYDGTGFIAGITGSTMMIATAWHVIRDLQNIDDKFQRYIELESAVGDMTIRAHAVALARFGTDEEDIGIVWVGPPFDESGIDQILKKYANSGMSNGILDLSGGGGIIDIKGDRPLLTGSHSYDYLARNQVNTGMDVGWLGYPSIENENICFFRGVISSKSTSNRMYLVDGTVLTGLSGSPVFCDRGGIVGIISKYIGDPDTASGMIEVAPISEVKTTF